ncbi:glycosyl transferase [Vibrio inusitatus NBRC 102082]|uniref:Glycosyl transferase n=1 Tax=Vibrio inusitatus NBRC 102082 TaxID=1219070 RepID=A0A4Y3HVW4_9VIBR|nr:glycosyltransferase family 2 protein [Vibrio inusitatus]GEA51313.1 glycosyl transferase [Vibrio inusitatus NBRC 102082]
MTLQNTSLSVTIITKNEEDRIESALQSVEHIATEIIVLDSGSTDRTVEIAKKYTDLVFETDWPGYGKQKQRALDLAKCEWVLSLDADEVLDNALSSSIIEALNTNNPEYSAYKLPWGVTIHGKTLKYGRSARATLRLFRRHGARFTLDEVHEGIVPSKGKTGQLKGLLLHYTQRDFGHGLDKSAKYAWLGAQKYFRKGKKPRPFPIIILGAIWSFFHIYILRLGFMDGPVGFMVAARYAIGNYNKHMGLWFLYYDKKNSKSQ